MERTGLRPIDELIQLAKNGNGLAFTALWDRHIDQLRSYIKNRFKNIDDYDVDDICSRSFEKAFRQIHNYDETRSQFLTWLSTIARNTALDSLEKEKRVHPKNQIVYLDDDSQSSGFEGIPDQTEDALNTLIKTESEEERIKYIDRLPDLYRTVARKRLIDGMKYDEIAENMDLELNTVKTRLRRAKQMMDSMRADSGE
ncbi:MAG: sigma-70 family RNA polymerase sigma factor [Bacteroidales bacterium]|jgi:RNA polymerase sigma-70 factor (ECF subfamily)|nr:sigma-70 family RNA polymerase sigma factor [Bacteroidales bacterium]